MSLAPLNDQVRFAMASEIADAAGCIDLLKCRCILTTDEFRDATLCAQKLHDHAAILAGSRSAEIYALADEEEIHP